MKARGIEVVNADEGKDDLSFTVKTAWRKGDWVYFLLKTKDDALCPAKQNMVQKVEQPGSRRYF